MMTIFCCFQCIYEKIFPVNDDSRQNQQHDERYDKRRMLDGILKPQKKCAARAFAHCRFGDQMRTADGFAVQNDEDGADDDTLFDGGFQRFPIERNGIRDHRKVKVHVQKGIYRFIGDDQNVVALSRQNGKLRDDFGLI